MTNAVLKTAARAARILPAPLRQGFYRLGPISRLIRRTLTRAAPQGLTEIEIAAGPARGFRMLLDLQSEKDYWLGTYEPQLQQALADFAGPGMTIYDVGANIGYVSLMFAAAAGETGRIYAFEALPENVERLNGHIRLNGLDERVTATHAAVVDRVREVRFRRGPSHATGKPAGDETEDDIPVPGITLDQFVSEPDHQPPDLIKIDIEGGEVLALPGMAGVLAHTRPVVFLELHGPESAAAAWDVLGGIGYRLHAMRSSYPLLERPDETERKAYIVGLPAGNP